MTSREAQEPGSVVDGVFHLPSLSLSSDYDMPIEPMPMPGKLTHGRDPALFLIDGAGRAPKRMARLLAADAMVGIRVTPPIGRVRVRLTLLVDPLSTQLWAQRDDNVSAPHLHVDEKFDAPDLSSRFRLVDVHAQGVLRGTVMLALKPGEGLSRQKVVFELDPAEVESGLLMLEFSIPGAMPAVGAGNLLERGAIGVSVGRLEVVEGGGAPPAENALSSGRAVEHGGTHTLPDIGYVVVNPLPRLGAPELEVGAYTPPALGRRAMVRHPVRSAQALRERRVTPTDLSVRVTDRAGSVLHTEDRTVPEGGSVRVALPEVTEPLFVELTGGPWQLGMHRT